MPNFAKIGRTVPEIWPIFDFSRWRPVPFGGPIRVTVPNFAKIGQTVREIWPIFDLQDGGRRHLGFWKFQIFNG